MESAGPDVVRAALAASAEVGPFFTLGVGESGGDWRPAAAAYPGGLSDFILRTGQRLGVTEARVAASTVQLAYAARLWSPVLACGLLRGLVPDLTYLCLATSPSLRLGVPEPRGWWVPGSAGTAELAAVAYQVVVGQNLEPLAAGLPVKVAPGLLHGNAAAAMTAALRVLAAAHPGLAGPSRALAGALLDTGILRGAGDLTGAGLEFRRRSCCLFYRVPGGGLCGDCSLPGVPGPRRPG